MKKILVIIVVIITAGCSSSGEKGDQSTGLKLEFTDTAKALLGLFSGQMTEPDNTKPCRITPSLAGFNHIKKKDNGLCTEEQLKQLDPYIGSYTGIMNGADQGMVKLNVSRTGGVTGTINSNKHGLFEVRGSFVLNGDTLMIVTSSLKSVTINASVSQAGSLTGTWKDDKSKTNGQIRASLSKRFK